jgi:hypothetical protein
MSADLTRFCASHEAREVVERDPQAPLVAGVRGITLEQRPVNPVRFFGGLGGRLAVPEVTVSYT